MSDGRSKRSHKKVKYTAYGDDDDDDDFADLTPPAKKAKLSSKTSSKEKSSKKDNQNKENSLQRKAVNNVHQKKSARKTPEERSYDREIQAALDLSLQESQGSETDTESDNVQGSTVNITECVIQAETHRERLDINTADPDLPPVINHVTHDDATEPADHTDKPAPILQLINNHVDSDDKIEIIPCIDEVSSKRRAKSKAVVIDEDSDFDDDEDFNESDDSDDDYDGSDSDEDFGKKKTKGKTAAKGKAKKQMTPKSKPKATTKTATKVAKTTTKTKTAPVKKSTPSTTSVISRPALSSPTSRSVGGGLPKWTPPASVGGTNSNRSSLGGISVKSPTSGLRLGLSRNQRVKPLHSGCKVQH